MRGGSQKAHQMRNRIGIWFAAVYVLVVITAFVVTAINTLPGNVGLDWIPFWSLALPWSRISMQMLLPGFLINALIFYLLGWMLGALTRRFIRP